MFDTPTPDWEELFSMTSRAFPYAEFALREAPSYGANLVLQESVGWRITWLAGNPSMNQFREQNLKPITQEIKDLLAAMPVKIPLQNYLPDPLVGLKEELMVVNKQLGAYRNAQFPDDPFGTDSVIIALGNRIVSATRVLVKLPPRWVSDDPIRIVIDEARRMGEDLWQWLCAVGNYVPSWTNNGQLITHLELNTIDKSKLDELVGIYGMNFIESGHESLTRVLASAVDRYQPDPWSLAFGE